MKKELQEKLLDRLKSVRGMNPKSGMSYALEHFSELTRQGSGLSRREITRGTGKLSPFIHAWSTFDRYTGIVKDFVNFCKERGINKLHKLTYDAVSKFLLEKVERELTRNTIKTNMCALMKFFQTSGRGDLRDHLAKDYPHFKYLAKLSRSIYAFNKPTELIAKIAERDELSGVVAGIERLTGARIHEVRPLLTEGETIVIKKGKGGKRRTIDFSNRLQELEKVKVLLARLNELAKGIDWQEYSRGVYQSHVKAACRALKDEYAGAHGFRGVYSQELNKKLKAEGMPLKKREQRVTEDLGHNRRSMARHYLSS